MHSGCSSPPASWRSLCGTVGEYSCRLTCHSLTAARMDQRRRWPVAASFRSCRSCLFLRLRPFRHNGSPGQVVQSMKTSASRLCKRDLHRSRILRRRSHDRLRSGRPTRNDDRLGKVVSGKVFLLIRNHSWRDRSGAANGHEETRMRIVQDLGSPVLCLRDCS